MAQQSESTKHEEYLRKLKRFLRLPQVEEKTGLKKSTIYSLVATGDFPAPVKLGQRCSAWVESEIEDWQDARITNRNNAA